MLILVRKLKMKQLVTELKKEAALRDKKSMRRFYSETVKLSARILKLILHLQYLEPLLKREFVFNGTNYDASKGYLYH